MKVKSRTAQKKTRVHKYTLIKEYGVEISPGFHTYPKLELYDINIVRPWRGNTDVMMLSKGPKKKGYMLLTFHNARKE